MEIAKLPLADRLGRLDRGESAYPEHTACVIQHIANTPITAYLAKFGAELEQLLELLELTLDKASDMTYRDIAFRVHELYAYDETDDRAIQALGLLAVPLINECQIYEPDDGLEEV